MGSQPRDYCVPPRKVFGTAKLSGWRVPKDEDFTAGTRAAGAAAVQHELSKRVRRRPDVARAAGCARPSLYRHLRG
jgi:hypothetical protein